MLTPASTDPNRKSELERREIDPVSFGAAHDQAVKQRLKDQEAAAENSKALSAAAASKLAKSIDNRQ